MWATVSTIDGRKWLERRAAFLEGELANAPDDDRRRAIEAELTDVRAELDRSTRRWWRFWAVGGRLP